MAVSYRASGWEWKNAAVCACALLWALPGLCLAADEVLVSVEELQKKIKPLFLSDTDGRYKLLERVQADYCQRPGSLPCESRSGMCAMIVLERYMELEKMGAALADKEGVLHAALDSCVIHGTRFEATGSHQALSASVAKVHSTARAMSISLHTPPIIGALPLPELNAVANQVAVPIIYVNPRFASFVADFSKIVCLSIPVKYSPGVREIFSQETPSRLLIEQSPSIREALLYYLAAYTGQNDDRRYNSTLLCDDVMRSYSSAVVDFVVAHEYAHLALRHPASLSTPLLYAPSPTQGASRELEGTPSPLLRELEADGYAYRILAQAPEKFSFKDESGVYKNYLGAIEFYFQVREIFLDAAGLQVVATEDPSEEAMAALAERVAACIKDPGCAVAGFEAELAKAYDREAHPPARFRRAVAKSFRRLVMKDLPDSNEVLIDLLSRNARLLWAATRPEWDARAADKAKFAMHGGGSAGGKEGELAATERVLRARQDLSRLAEEHPDQLDYAAGLNAVAGDLGELMVARGDLPAARSEFGTALLGAKRLAEAARGASETRAKTGKRQMAAALRALARLEAQAGDPAKASSNYDGAIDIAEGLFADERGEQSLREDLAELLVQSANLKLRLGDAAQAETTLFRLGRLLDESPSRSVVINEMQSVRSELLWNLGKAKSDSGAVGPARVHYTLAVVVLERLAGSSPTDVEHQRLLAQRSTLLAINAPDLQSWRTVVAKWEELERRGGLKDSDRTTVAFARTQLANQNP